jgi:hypothetical protein
MHEGRSESRFLQATISEVQSALARRAAVRAGLWAAAAVLGAMAALMAVDAATAFAAGFRGVVYGLAVAAGAGGIAAAAMAGRARVLTPMGVAQVIERFRPDLKNALLTFVEMQSDPGADPSMTAAVGRRAARILAQARVEDFVPVAGLGRAAWAATGAACLMGATLWLVQGVLFDFGPAAAAASPMMGGATSREPHAGGREPGAAEHEPDAGGQKPGAAERELNADGQKPGAETLEGSRGSPADLAAGAGTSAAGSGTGGKEATQSLAAALEADKEKLEKLAQALGEGPAAGASNSDLTAGARNANGQTPNAGSVGVQRGEETGAVPFSGMAKGTVPFSQQREKGTAPFAAPPAKHVPGSGSRSNEEKRVSPGEGPATRESNPGLTAGARNSSPPIPKRPQSEAFPEKTLDAMRKVRRLIDEADTRLREGEVTDAFLGRMGMSNAEFHRFVAAWQRRIETAAVETGAPPAALRQTPGAAGPKVEFIPGGAGTDARPIGGIAPLPGAVQGGAVQGADTGVSVRLRPAVSAYFEAVGKLAAEKAEAKATP